MTRRDLEAMLALADRLDAAGEHGVFATLIATRGSSYRPLGSMMLAGPPGTPRAGGVSGGCLEEYIARHGRALLAERPAALLGFDTTADGEAATGRPTLGCGGHVDVLVERFTADHRRLLERFHRATTCGPATAIATAVTVRSDALAREELDIHVLREAISADESLNGLAFGSLRHDQSTSDATTAATHTLVQHVSPQPRLIVCGAGDDVRPLVTLAAMADWSVRVVDRRARLATRERFRDADQVAAVDAEWQALPAHVNAGDTVVLLTHDLADDVAICRTLASGPTLAYLGVLGPAHRMDWLREALREQSVDDAFVRSVRGPIGLDLGGRSPEQIALAIVAELTALRFGRDGRPLSDAAVSPGAGVEA